MKEEKTIQALIKKSKELRDLGDRMIKEAEKLKAYCANLQEEIKDRQAVRSRIPRAKG